MILIDELKFVSIYISDEHNCGKPSLLIEENWALLDILLIMLLLTAGMLFIIVCGVKN